MSGMYTFGNPEIPMIPPDGIFYQDVNGEWSLDCPRCGEAESWTGDNLRHVAHDAQAAGWRSLDNVWYCAKCVPELLLPPKREATR